MSDTDIDTNLCESYHEVSKHHSEFLEAITKLDKTQRIKKAERSEPGIEVSEYHLIKSGIRNNDEVRLQDLVKLSGQKAYQNNISKRLGYIQQKNQVLAKPLEKPTAERIKRTIGYEGVKKELTKWDGIVARNRAAEQLFFPLKQPSELKDSGNSKIPAFLRRFSIKSDLMKKIEEVDPSLLYPPAEEEKKDDNYKLTMEELILRRKETAKFRAQQSYKEARARRQSKIKSKKFHRIQRKGRIKQQLKEFEELKSSNPREALAKLEQLDKTRAEERMSLRHKNTGQWARNKQIRVKYDKETRQALASQLAIGRELTQKVKRVEEESNDSDDEEDEVLLESGKKDNAKTESDIDNFIQTYRKYWDERHQNEEKKKIKVADKSTSERKDTDKSKAAHNKVIQDDEPSKVSRKKTRVTKDNKQSCDSTATPASRVEEYNEKKTGEKRLNKKLKSQNVNEMSDSVKKKKKPKRKADQKSEKIKKKPKINSQLNKQKKEEEEHEDYLPNLEFSNLKRKPVLDCPLDETTSRESGQKDENLANLRIIDTEEESVSKKREAEIDPEKYLNIKPRHLITELPDMATAGDDDSEHEQQMREIMCEAFADDDIVDEFNKEKEEEMKKSQLEQIDLGLPGWGSWAGTNIKNNKRKAARKKKRFILNIPKEPPRRPENQGKVIIFEKDNPKLKKHLVSELPYPFTRVTDYEAIIRAPISRTFVPMNAHMRLTQPTINTKLGQVIQPMDESELVKNQPTIKKPLKRRVDKKNDSKNTARNNKKKCKQDKITQ